MEDLDAHLAAYQQEFEFYEENQWYLRHYAERVCAVVRERKLRSLLSLGIGHEVVSGKLMAELGRSIERYTILEGSAAIIAQFRSANRPGDDVELIHTRFEDFVAERRFDGIEMGFVLEHVDEPLALVRRFKSLLSPGGTMFIAVPNARSLHRLIGHEAGLLDDVYRLSEQDHALGHKRYFDLERITALVEAAGLEIVHRQGLMLKPVTAAQMKALGWEKNIIDALFKVGDRYPEIANCILIEARP